MPDLRVCFEVDGLAQDENSNPCPAGLEITLIGSKSTVPYEQLASSINLDAVLRYFCLSELIGPENIRVITPEEYDEKYGDESDE